MQAKDIPDMPVLLFLQSLGKMTGTWFTSDEFEIAGSVLKAMPEGTPEKVALAKMRSMIRRGLVKGCTCGCRGNFVLTNAGRAVIAKGAA